MWDCLSQLYSKILIVFFSNGTMLDQADIFNDKWYQPNDCNKTIWVDPLLYVLEGQIIIIVDIQIPFCGKIWHIINFIKILLNNIRIMWCRCGVWG